jgi:hypothetical protein
MTARHKLRDESTANNSAAARYEYLHGLAFLMDRICLR